MARRPIGCSRCGADAALTAGLCGECVSTFTAESRAASGVGRHVVDGPTLDRAITLLGLNERPAVASTPSAGGSAAAAAGGVDGTAGQPASGKSRSSHGRPASRKTKQKAPAGADTPMAGAS